MCVEITCLNKVCLRDNFLLPRIDNFVDAAVGCEMLCLLDCLFGDHQIWMKQEYEEKTSFTTIDGH